MPSGTQAIFKAHWAFLRCVWRFQVVSRCMHYNTSKFKAKSRLNDILFFWRFKPPNVLQGVIISSAEHDEFH